MDAGITPGGSELLRRAKAMILAPREEWPRIVAEAKPVGDILRGYVLPLALIGPVASLIGGQIFGYGAFITYRPSLIAGIGTAVVGFALTLVGVGVLTLIAEFLAPKFDGVANRANAFRLVAYGSTAAWLVGIFGLIPSLAFFGLLGLYSLYLFYTGVTPLMQVPAAKAAGYTAVTMLCALLLSLIVSPITGAIMGALGMGAALTADAGGTVNLPGGRKVDVRDADQFARQMEDAASGKIPPVAASRLQELLPATINGYARSETSSGSVGQLGSTAEGRYEADGKRIILKLVDMSALGAVAGMGAAMGVEQSREDADSYEKTGVVDGQMRIEEWNRKTGQGRYAVMVGNRFMIEAQGNPGSVEELKAAVAQIDQEDLEDLLD